MTNDTRAACAASELKQGRLRCKALNDGYCHEGHCAFYKSDAEVKVDREKAYERLRSLPADTQRYIAKEYHGGKMPWKTKGS